MGARGPIPEREANLARPRERKGKDEQPVKKGTLFPTHQPEADPEWTPLAKMIWQSLADSGQSAYYQQSDWAYAYMLCEQITEYHINLETGEVKKRRSPEMLKAIMNGLSNLLMTEGDRRRVRIELEEPEVEESKATLTIMSQYKENLGVK